MQKIRFTGKMKICVILDKAETLIKKQHYADANVILKTITVDLKMNGNGKELILALIKQIRCLVMITKMQDAVGRGDAVFSIIKNENFDDDEVENYYNELEQLVQIVIQIQNSNLALTLHRCLIYLTQFYKQGIKKLQNFENLGCLMLDIVKRPINQDHVTKFEQNMDEIFYEMQLIKDVKSHIKIRQIATFLLRFGSCYGNAHRYVQAVTCVEHAISLMKTVFDEQANSHLVLALCYNNLGVLYEKLYRLIDAKIMFEKALSVFEQVKDWNDDEQKIEDISKTSRNWQIVKEKIHKTKYTVFKIKS